MKKSLLYTGVAVIVLAVIMLIVLNKQPQKFDRRITLDKKQTHPYDLSILREKLPLLFNNPRAIENRQSPKDWFTYDSSSDGKTIFFLVTRHFSPDEDELGELMDFVRQGNQVFISTPYMNDAAEEYFGLNEDWGQDKDSGATTLQSPPFTDKASFINPGRSFSSFFRNVDLVHYFVLSKDEGGNADFVKLNAGKGSFYFHSNPLLLANYFLLHGNNLSYLEKVASLMPQKQDKIIWDEHYVYKTSRGEKTDQPSFLHVLFSVPAFKWAFTIALILLLLYVLLGLKLLQRAIPLWEKPRNETLDFTKTIGRLYFAQGDNLNLAKKMSVYLLEYIRNKYFINTNTLNEDFIANIAAKSGYSEELTKEMVGHVAFIQSANKVSEQQLATIYQSFSKFYKHTS